MATTPRLGMTLVESAQAQKEITINEALTRLDSFVAQSVIDKDLATPPTSPSAGDVYIVAASPTGTWAGKAAQIAFFDQVWRFLVPYAGLRVWVVDEALDYRFNGTAWVAVILPTGDVVGPASATSTAIARFSGATGKLIQNSGVLIDASNNMSGIGTLVSGTQTITSTSADALAVGPNGATNPVLDVDASVASSATGVQIRGNAAGSGASIIALSSAANENLAINAKGLGNLVFGTGSQRIGVLTAAPTHSLTLASATTGYVHYNTADQVTNYERGVFRWSSNTFLIGTEFAGSAVPRTIRIGSGGTAGADVSAGRTLDFSATIPFFRINASTGLAGNIFDFSSVIFVGAATAQVALSVNPTINQSGTGSYTALLVNPTETATGSGIKALLDCQVGGASRLRVESSGKTTWFATNTAAGTTGAQTINRPSGTVNFAAGATSLVVTNTLCTTASLVFATIRTNDATAVIKNVVPAAGSFTITLNAAATAETSVGFFIIN
jgi:hypothetical protein